MTEVVGVEIPLPGGKTHSTKYPIIEDTGIVHVDSNISVDIVSDTVYFCGKQYMPLAWLN